MASKAKTKKIVVQPSRNSRVLASFIQYCVAHPEERFWQALRNWSGYDFILIADYEQKNIAKVREGLFWENVRDTFFKEDK